MGGLFMRSAPCEVTLHDDSLTVTLGSRTFRAPISVIRKIDIQPGRFWTSITFPYGGGKTETLEGIPNHIARDLDKTLREALRAHDRVRDRDELMRDLHEQLIPVLSWHLRYAATIAHHEEAQRWITEEAISAAEASRPALTYRGRDLRAFLQDPTVQARLRALPHQSQTAIDLWMGDLRAHASSLNEKFVESELKRCKRFFATIERSPLTVEQARAAICFDNRVQVIAAAGSGKTSTLVAKAGYALHRGLVPAKRMLILAFNKAVASELRARLNHALRTAGLDPEGIEIRTFHGFGLDTIGRATGRKPSLAPDLDRGNGTARLAGIIDDLKASEKGFRAQWDLFRMVFARDLPGFGKEDSDPDAWDAVGRYAGFRTLNGEIVKSEGERLIADWLFFHGVTYLYEPQYEHDTADAEHRQYQPDFYYPDAGLYHEHFALDAQGRPPESFDGYMAGVQWKRETHRHHGTDLLETTTADLWDGSAFTKIKEALIARGVSVAPNPNRQIQGRKPIEHASLTKLFRTFLTHAKNNQLTEQDLRDRLAAEPIESFRFRYRLFLALFARIRNAWEQRLQDEGVIDFEDMLGQATELISTGQWKTPYRLVMVDEFQDASRARARMVRALVAQPGCHLFTVGDDWQSIYRFAGADISVMTQFEEWFGPSQQLHLQRTFRCPQWLCDMSSAFVLKNPAQIRKNVVSTHGDTARDIWAIEVEQESGIGDAITAHLQMLYERHRTDDPMGGPHSRETVYILGRYRADQKLLPRRDHAQFSDRLAIEFTTVHSAKGLEADHVVIPRLKSGLFGFPSNIADDPVLRLAMPPDDQMHNAEERRLFYVALTRAKRSVALFTITRQHSRFFVDLVQDDKIEIYNATTGSRSSLQSCPKCKQGSLIQRSGRFGPFIGCTRFPACQFSKPIGRPGPR